MQPSALARTFSTLPSRARVAHWLCQAATCIQPMEAMRVIVERILGGSAVSLSLIRRRYRPGPLPYEVAGHGRSAASPLMAWIFSWRPAIPSEPAHGVEENRLFDLAVVPISPAKRMTSGLQ